MKKLVSFIVLASFSAGIFASDVITLSNQMKFEGKVMKIKNCMLLFRAVDGKKYRIPAKEIYSVQFEDPADAVLTDYLMAARDPDNCLKATRDVEMYHGKKGVHVLYGFLFGPFAMIGSALSSPSPYKDDTAMMSENKDLFSDPEYLHCYRKKATGQNIGMEGIGWATWILLLVI